jgi:hypothetical protein
VRRKMLKKYSMRAPAPASYYLSSVLTGLAESG